MYAAARASRPPYALGAHDCSLEMFGATDLVAKGELVPDLEHWGTELGARVGA